MITRYLSGIAVACFFLGLGNAAAELKVSPFFGPHMVLQREEPIIVWGNADAGTEVSVTLGEDKATTKTDTAGHWKAELKSRAASGPFALTVNSGSETVKVDDIMIGDLWLISGQSNVVLTLAASKEWPEVKTAGVFKDIRVCKLPGTCSFEPLDQFSRPTAWAVLDAARAGSFLSGVGYHFIRTIQPAAGVTVGLVQGAAGGTQIEEWIPEAALKAADSHNLNFANRAKALEKLAADPAAKLGPIEAGASAMYDGTIHPMRFAKWKGVVWYQGEANARTKEDYTLLLKTFIPAWREVFGQPALPFIIVQLPNFGEQRPGSWVRLREMQMFGTKAMNVPLVVTIDQGAKETIHPPNKAEVGRRAGLAALQYVYKQDVEGTSPTPKSVQFQGGTAFVEFDGFKGDLVVKGDSIKGFELAGADQKFVPASAKVEGRRVIVAAEGLAEPKAVRYLWENSPDAVTLYSAAGLPVGQFRSDAWPAAETSPWFAGAAK